MAETTLKCSLTPALARDAFAALSAGAGIDAAEARMRVLFTPAPSRSVVAKLAAEALRSPRQQASGVIRAKAMAAWGSPESCHAWTYRSDDDCFSCECVVRRNSLLVTCSLEVTFFVASLQVARTKVSIPGEREEVRTFEFRHGFVPQVAA